MLAINIAGLLLIALIVWWFWLYKSESDTKSGGDAVIHVALFWGETESSILSNDTLSTVKLFEMAEKAGVKRFIFTSSTAAIGYKNSVCTEDMMLDPEDHYGAAKAASEMFLKSLSRK